MATIKERAQTYRKDTEQSIYKSLEGMSTMEIEYAYIHGATDQQTIDIETVCELIRKELTKFVELLDCIETGYGKLIDVEGSIAAFRAAMNGACRPEHDCVIDEEHPKWHSVEDCLPDYGESVLVHLKNGSRTITHRSKNDYSKDNNDFLHVVIAADVDYWIELPEFVKPEN